MLGFLCACGISSSNYIINDIKDREQDVLHPKKKIRPLAAGAISKNEASIILLVLLSISFICSWFLSFWFFISMMTLFILSQAYTFYLKRLIIVDVLTISINFIIRGIAGLCILYSLNATWLLPDTWSFWALFMLALFLALIKRKTDLHLLELENNSNAKNEFLSIYPKKFLDQLLFLISGIFLMGYYLYVIINDATGGYLVITIPIATYLMFKILYLIYFNEQLITKAKSILKDPGIVIGSIIVFLLFLLLNYLHFYGFI